MNLHISRVRVVIDATVKNQVLSRAVVVTRTVQQWIFMMPSALGQLQNGKTAQKWALKPVKPRVHVGPGRQASA